MTGITHTRLHRNRIALWPLLLIATGLIPAVAIADSTTGTSLTITGTPTPGKQVTANVVVVGKHLVYGPPHSPVSVPGGSVQISINGTIVLSIQATGGINSNVIDSGCVKPGPYPGTCDIAKYISDNTTFSALIALPKGSSQYTISAKYTGDDDSHPSTSQDVVLTPVYPGVSAAVDLLLND
jgi:hypothetical protein